MKTKLYTLSPSSFAFLWDECKSCFWAHVVQNFRRPMAPFPSIFSRIDSAMKVELETGRHSLGAGPTFTVVHSSRMVTSTPIVIPNRSVSLVIRGQFDSIVKFEDNSPGICDFKTAPVKEEYNAKYGRQLHAYAYALDHPAANSLAIPDIKRLGLGVFEPTSFKSNGMYGAALQGDTAWVELEYDRAGFMAFLDEVAALLELPEAPRPNLGCEHCRYKVLNAWRDVA
jgi:hypothetical protein